MKRERPYDMIPQGFGIRAQQARAIRDLMRARSGEPRASVTALAEEVGAELKESVSSGDVGRWLGGQAVPSSLARITAFARVLDVDPGWLSFGDASRAPAPALLADLPLAPRARLPERKTPTKRRRG